MVMLQDALLRCSQWPVELAAEGSPGQPLCLAPVSAKRLGLRLPTFALPPPKLRATTANGHGVEDGQASVSDHKESPEQWQPRLDQVRVGWQRLCELYKEVEVEAPAALTVLAGLRVRVGLHTGLAADEVMVQRRMGASSITYGGAALVLAKAVQACAHGGQITLNAATFVKLPVEELRAAGISVVHMGQHLVALGEGKGATALELYCACLNTPDHAHRLWALGPLRTLRQLQPGVLHAPVRAAAVAFMSVVGLPQLKAWSAELAQLPAGYWVSSAEEEGMVLAAFPSSLQCLHWALLTLTTCMDMDWPQALLDSASGEEVVIAQAGPSWAAAPDTTAAADPPLAASGEAGDPGASMVLRDSLGQHPGCPAPCHHHQRSSGLGIVGC
ncbi:predicted protein [Haematococcus lacustris]|uniref:Guanylate cyclase domain-containing protein n=1 Tax=Haematococcus lacustris TaxID=44745 RepID=A0A699YLA6_HAELA|nr:predicted protein [Haematococcus lacustris]